MRCGFVGLFLLVLGIPIVGKAHIRLNSPLPRVGTTDGTKTTNSETNPCGGVARGNTNLTAQVGSSLNFSWDETINHPGRFIIQFSPGLDKDFELPSNELFRKEDTENKGSHTASVKLPMEPCEACTLRLVQVMDDQPGELYVACVNIRLTSAEVPPPSGPGNENSSSNPSSQSERRADSGGGKSQMPGGCGLVSDFKNQDKGSSTYEGGVGKMLNLDTGRAVWSLLLLSFPLIIFYFLRFYRLNRV